MSRKPFEGIPPPPLPEFYLSRHPRDHENTNIAARNKHQAPIAVASPCQSFEHFEARPGQDSKRWRQPKAYAKLPVGCTDVPPLAVYHICRICLRPRSETFHRNNPIPINGIPPPPGICRRCRIAPIEEIASVADVVTKYESNDIKLGVKCLAPDGDNSWIEGTKVSHGRRQSCCKRNQSRCQPDLQYRHIEVDVTRSSSGSSSLNRDHVERPERKPQDDSTPSDSREEDRADSEIRRIAREEVERYRQAERKLQAHQDPYAHGRMIPVERRIVERRISFEEVPWRRPSPQQEKGVGNQAYDGRDAQGKPSPPIIPGKGWDVDFIHSSQSNKPSLSVEQSKQDTSDTESIAIKLREIVGIEKQMGKSHHKARQERYSSSYDSTSSERDVTSKNPDAFPIKSRLPPLPRSQTRTTKDMHLQKERPLPERIEELRDGYDRQYRASLAQLNHKAVSHGDKPRNHAHNGSEKSGPSPDMNARQASQAHKPNAPRSDKTVMPRNISDSNKTHERVGNTYSDSDTGPKFSEYDTTYSAPSIRSTGSRKTDNLNYTRQSQPPFREEGFTSPAPKLSPYVAHRSPAHDVRSRESGSRTSAPPSTDYFYMERTVQPTTRPRHARTYYGDTEMIDREVEEYLSRGKASRAPAERPSASKSLREQILRPSILSGRVQFNDAVDYSPTPPGSDASSAQFRNFAGKRGYRRKDTRHSGDEHKPNEYGHRGRSRDRGRDDVYSRDAVPRLMRDELQNSHQRSDIRHGANKPNVLAGAFSESPSREQVDTSTLSPPEDGKGPYRAPEKPSTSLIAEYGSDDGWNEMDVRRVGETSSRRSRR